MTTALNLRAIKPPKKYKGEVEKKNNFCMTSDIEKIPQSKFQDRYFIYVYYVFIKMVNHKGYIKSSKKPTHVDYLSFSL